MANRTIAIGDVHGCLKALETLVDAIEPRPADTIITLGDYVDRGPDSRGVIDLILAVAECCRVIPLLGNHEAMLLSALGDTESLRRWITCGGVETLLSYGWVKGGRKRTLASWFPESHQRFLADCRSYHETLSHVFVHGGYVPELPISQQSDEILQWRVTDAATAKPHVSGKRVIVGHTPQKDGQILDLGFLICIDTNCVRGGWLTALEVTTGEAWQSNQAGLLRRVTLM